jgi:2'-5' RNA ligase
MSVRRRSVHPGQLSFHFADMPPDEPVDGPDDAVFLAVMPDPAAAQTLAVVGDAMGRRLGLAGKRRPVDILHVSLVPIGPYGALSPALLDRVKQAVSELRLPGFVVAFDHVCSLGHGGRRPFVLSGGEGVVGLERLHDTLRGALGLPAVRFLPHMTILYGRREIPLTPLEASVAWPVRELVLVHSRYGQGRYDILGRWSLVSR